MDVLPFMFIVAGVSAVLGALVRRWWVLTVPVVLYLGWLVVAGDNLDEGQGDLNALGVALAVLLWFVAPAVVGLALGVAAGRHLRPPPQPQDH